MSETKFTPGPWAVICGEDNMGDPLTSVVAFGGDTICDSEQYYPTRLHPRNADLIAAAPDLHDAVAFFVNWFNNESPASMEVPLELVEKGEAALKKARGE